MRISKSTPLKTVYLLRLLASNVRKVLTDAAPTSVSGPSAAKLKFPSSPAGVGLILKSIVESGDPGGDPAEVESTATSGTFVGGTGSKRGGQAMSSSNVGIAHPSVEC